MRLFQGSSPTSASWLKTTLRLGGIGETASQSPREYSTDDAKGGPKAVGEGNDAPRYVAVSEARGFGAYVHVNSKRQRGSKRPPAADYESDREAPADEG